MISNLNSQQIEELLNGQIVGRIGCHAEGVTYVVPISYAYDGEYIYGHTREGMKVNMMRQNPSVCFEVEETRDVSNWKSVITWGMFEELEDPDERNKALQHLVNRILPLASSQTMRLTPHWPFPPNNINSIRGIVFRIRLHKKTGRFEDNSVSFAYP